MAFRNGLYILISILCWKDIFSASIPSAEENESNGKTLWGFPGVLRSGMKSQPLLKPVADVADILLGQFETFLTTFNKNYSSEAEKVFRFGIFKENLKIAEKMTEEAAGMTTFGVTRFSDLTLYLSNPKQNNITSKLEHRDGVVWNSNVPEFRKKYLTLKTQPGMDPDNLTRRDPQDGKGGAKPKDKTKGEGGGAGTEKAKDTGKGGKPGEVKNTGKDASSPGGTGGGGGGKFRTGHKSDKTPSEEPPLEATTEGALEKVETECSNWSKKSPFPGVLDQADCGSCYSFGTTMVLNILMSIKTKKVVRLSEQQIVDCTHPKPNFGCEGGYISETFDYMKTVGLVNTATYPYTAKLGACKAKAGVVKLKSYEEVKGEKGIFKALKTSPVTIALNADSMMNYKSGILMADKKGAKKKICDPKDLNHAVAVVGYCHEKKGKTDVGYWIVQNSWGVSFGEKGFVRMEAFAGNCGIGRVNYKISI